MPDCTHADVDDAADFIMEQLIADVKRMVTLGLDDDLRALLYNLAGIDGMSRQDILEQARGLGWC